MRVFIDHIEICAISAQKTRNNDIAIAKHGKLVGHTKLLFKILIFVKERLIQGSDQLQTTNFENLCEKELG